MNIYHAPEVAAAAVSANVARPATALTHDSADARVVLFRIEPGQEVARHTSSSTVLLIVISGAGVVSCATGDRDVRTGDIIAYDVDEPHGMRANTELLVIAAVIAPRPTAH
jgi:quercetin dioxygenase-like cupin family protein